MGNEETQKIEDLDIYIFGNINKRNYTILNSIFFLQDYISKGKIYLKDKNEDYYINKTYTYSFNKRIFITGKEEKEKEKEKEKVYNIYFFNYETIDKDFTNTLSFYLYENDLENKRKNVFLCFGFDFNIIESSISSLRIKSRETIPFLIFIGDNYKYQDKLNYINFIPDLNTILNHLKEDNPNLSNNALKKSALKLLSQYLLKKLFRIYAYYNQIGYNLNFIEILNENNSKINFNLTIALLGLSGGGKSTLLNLIYDDLVSRAILSSKDVTTKFAEYYFPINYNLWNNSQNLGQIRFIDCPGLKKDDLNQYNYIKNKIEEYQKNFEQIDFALFYISNDLDRDFTPNCLKLIKLLHENKIKIIFIMNGRKLDDKRFNMKKESLKNAINNNNILSKDFNNLIRTDYYQYFEEKQYEGIPELFKKIKELIALDPKFNVNSLTKENYKNEFEILRKNCRVFQSYSNIENMIENIQLKSISLVTGTTLLSLGTSFLSMVVPLVDTALSYAYQAFMIKLILNIYGYNSNDYSKKDIANIILSGGDKINFKTNENNKITTCAIEAVSNGGKYITGKVFEKEGIKAAEIIAEKTITTTVKETIKDTTFTGLKFVTETKINEISTNAFVQTISSEGAIAGIKNISTDVLAKDSSLKFIGITTKSTVKEVSEEIVIRQGGSQLTVFLGKAVPFISVAISGIMNTYSTAKIGTKLINYLNNEIHSPERIINIIKTRVFALENICDQIDYIINQMNKLS